MFIEYTNFGKNRHPTGNPAEPFRTFQRRVWICEVRWSRAHQLQDKKRKCIDTPYKNGEKGEISLDEDVIRSWACCVPAARGSSAQGRSA